jgi:diacylglycerol kinase
MGGQRKQSLRQSFRHALEGLGYVICCERNARIHLAAAILAVALGLWLGLGLTQWAVITIAIALVFAGEMLNTVVELTIDVLTPHQNAHAKHVKDVAAGAILVNALAAVVIGLLVLGPPLLRKLGL